MRKLIAYTFFTLGIISMFFAYYLQYYCSNEHSITIIIASISLSGSIASIAGYLIMIIQLTSLQNDSDALRSAVNNAHKKIKLYTEIASSTLAIENIEIIVEAMVNDNLDLAHVKLSEFQKNISPLTFKDSNIKSEIIAGVNTALRAIIKERTNKDNTLNKDSISNKLYKYKIKLLELPSPEERRTEDDSR